MASRECNKKQIKKKKEIIKFRGKTALLYIKYEDHVLFLYCNPYEMDSCIREVVGWLTFENETKICISSDRLVDPLPNEKRESGFVILKNNIIEVLELLPNSFKQIRLVDYGQKA